MVNTDNAVHKPYFGFKIVALELDTIFHLFANTMSKYTSLTSRAVKGFQGCVGIFILVGLYQYAQLAGDCD